MNEAELFGERSSNYWGPARCLAHILTGVLLEEIHPRGMSEAVCLRTFRHEEEVRLSDWVGKRTFCLTYS